MLYLYLVIGCHNNNQQNNGQGTYDIYCALCHGSDGEGYIAPQANALGNPEFLAAATDEFIEFATIYGRPGTKMSPWGTPAGGPLEEEDISKIITYIRSWQTLPTADIHDVMISGHQENGSILYEQYCTSCHGIDGEGGSALSLNSPTFLETASDGFILHALTEGRSNTTMASYTEILSENEMHDIVSFIRSWEDN
jgi:cytochrome c oxidase cbb3-type subunit III